MQKNYSRRHFLNLVGAAGGSTAIYQTSLALGLLPETGPLALADIQKIGGHRKKVLILGAGISGLASAYELERAGYDCTVIEASKRIGGRNLTLRSGDHVDELGYDQVCNFDDDPNLTYNARPLSLIWHLKHLTQFHRGFKINLDI